MQRRQIRGGGAALALLEWLAYPSLYLVSTGAPREVYESIYNFDVGMLVRRLWSLYERGELGGYYNVVVGRGGDAIVTIVFSNPNVIKTHVTTSAIEEPETGEHSILSAYVRRGPVDFFVVTRFIDNKVYRIDIGFDIVSRATRDDVEWLASMLDNLVQLSASDAESMARLLDDAVASGAQVYMEIVTPFYTLSAYGDESGVYASERGLVAESIVMTGDISGVREYMVRHGRRVASFESAVHELLYGRER